MASNVFMISRTCCGRALEDQQIEFGCLAHQAGQHGVYLSAVMGLVIEPMRQRRCQLLLELLR